MKTRAEQKMELMNQMEMKLASARPLMQDYYSHLLASDSSAGTIEIYISNALRFEAFLQSTKGYGVENATDGDATAYFISLQTKTDANGNVITASQSRGSVAWSALNHLYTYLRSIGLCAFNPLRTIKKPSQHKDHPKRYYFTREEIVELMDKAREEIDETARIAYNRKWLTAIRNYALFVLLCHSGLRISAALNIDVNDIDWENRVIRIVEKRDHQFTLRMNESVYEAMAMWRDKRPLLIQGYPEIQAFFVGIGLRRLGAQTFTCWLERLAGDDFEGKKLAPHKIRASFACNLLEEVGDIDLVKNAMHHSSLSTTQIYVATDRNADKRASELMEDIYKKHE